jgi:hypothetical protein
MQNKTFMITGRHGSSQSKLLDDGEECEEHPKFGDRDEEEGDEEYHENISDEQVRDDGPDTSFNWH